MNLSLSVWNPMEFCSAQTSTPPSHTPASVSAPAPAPALSPAPVPRLICRFQTVPPIPFLKAAIGFHQDWSIEHLTHKINQTILSETADSQYFDLLQLPNPSHRLVLELADGCRLPINESCTIVDKEQILSVRLVPNPQFRICNIHDSYNIHDLTSQSSYPPLLPSPIHSSQRFSSDAPPSIHHLDSRNSSYLLQSESQLQAGQPPVPQPESQAIEDNPPTVTHVEPQDLFPESSPPTSQPVDHQSLFPIGDRFMPMQDHPTSACNLFPASENDRASDFVIMDPELGGETGERSYDDSTGNNPVGLDEQTHEGPDRSKLEDVKPPTDDLDGARRLPDLSETEVPRVRSHIAAVRKSAMGHYHSNHSSSSSSEDELIHSSDESTTCFSRHAKNLRSRDPKRPKSAKKSSRLQIQRHRSSLMSKRRSFLIRLSSSESSTHQTCPPHQSRATTDKMASKKRRVSLESGNVPAKSSIPSSSAPGRSSNLSQSKCAGAVRVVIPARSPSVALASQGRKKNKNEGDDEGRTKSDDTSTEMSGEIIAITSSPSESHEPEVRAKRVSRTARWEKGAKQNPTLTPSRATRSVYQIYVDDHQFVAASAQGPLRIAHTQGCAGLNEHSTLREVIKRLHLDLNASWKLIIGDKVWLSHASLERARAHSGRFSGLLDGRIIQLDFDRSLATLKVFPFPNPSNFHSFQIHVIRNWDLK